MKSLIKNLPVLLYIFILSTNLIFIKSNASTSFIKTYTHNTNPFDLSDPIQTNDLGYLFLGNIYDTTITQNNQALLLKTDINGSFLWSKVYSTTNHFNANVFVVDYDGAIIMAGTQTSAGLPSSMHIIKTDSTGNIIWSKAIGGSTVAGAASITLTPDSGYLITGSTNSLGTGSQTDIYLIKLDQFGNKIWSRALSKSMGADVVTAKSTYDGGFILTGHFSFPYSMMLIKIDNNGFPQWSKSYDGAQEDWAYDVVQTSDSGYMLTGTTRDGDDFTVIKSDVLGNIEWSKIISFASLNTSGYNIEKGNDNFYYLSGYVPDTVSNRTGFILKMDISGSILRAIRCSTVIGSLKQLQDSSIIFTESISDPAGVNGIQITKINFIGAGNCATEELKLTERQIILNVDTGITLILPTDSIWNNNTTVQSTTMNETTLCLINSIDKINSTPSLDLFPNPTSAGFNIRFNQGYNNEKKIFLINSLGKVVKSFTTNLDFLYINTQDIRSGIYRCIVYTGNEEVQSKSIIIVD